MFDLPPQVYEVAPNSIESVISSEKYKMPFADTFRTVLQINNRTGYKVYITSKIFDDYQWNGGARPNLNFNGVTIAGSNYLKRNEDMNADSTNATFFLNFKFTAASGDEEFGIKVEQADVFKPDFTYKYYPAFPLGTMNITGYYQVDQQVLGNANIFTISHNQ
jgi:hypothetical protein